MGSPTRIPNPSWSPLPFQEGERGKEEEREKESGGRRPLPNPIRTCHGGRALPPLVALLSFPLKPIKAQYFSGGFRYSPGTPKLIRYFPKPSTLAF